MNTRAIEPESTSGVVAGSHSLPRLVLPCRVVLFQPRFAPLVYSGQKLQTMRPTPKRPVRRGQWLSLREWSDKPYRSPQRLIRDTICKGVRPVCVDPITAAVCLDCIWLRAHEADRFAELDGFGDARDMAEWIVATHGERAFRGVVIYWPNDKIHP